MAVDGYNQKYCQENSGKRRGAAGDFVHGWTLHNTSKRREAGIIITHTHIQHCVRIFKYKGKLTHRTS